MISKSKSLSSVKALVDSTQVRVCEKCGEEFIVEHLKLNGPDGQPLEVAQECRCRREQRLMREQDQMRQMQSAICLQRSRLRGNLQTMTLESLEPLNPLVPAISCAQAFCQEVTSGKAARGLIFAGQFGCGKTHLACAIVNRLAQSRIDVEFWPCFEILDAVRDSFDAAEVANPIKRIGDVKVLVIDDLGNERIASDQRGDWAREQIFRIAYNREIKNLPTVITTNLSIPEFKIRLGGAAASRLLSLCAWIDIKAPDYRLSPHDHTSSGGPTS